MAKLQKALRGYADFIGRATQGNVGLEDIELLQPVINIDDFINERKTIVFDTAFTAVDQVAGVTVPDGKQWRVHYIAGQAQCDAGENLLLELHWRKVFGGATRYYPLDNFGPVIGNSPIWDSFVAHTKGHSAYPNIIIPAGDGLGLTAADIVTVGNVDARFVCQVTEWAL